MAANYLDVVPPPQSAVRVEGDLPGVLGCHQRHDVVSRFAGQFGVVDHDPHLGVQVLGARIEVHRAEKRTCPVDHVQLGMQAEVVTHHWADFVVGLHGCVGAQLVELDAGPQQRGPLEQLGRTGLPLAGANAGVEGPGFDSPRVASGPLCRQNAGRGRVGMEPTGSGGSA